MGCQGVLTIFFWGPTDGALGLRSGRSGPARRLAGVVWRPGARGEKLRQATKGNGVSGGAAGRREVLPALVRVGFWSGCLVDMQWFTDVRSVL